MDAYINKVMISLREITTNNFWDIIDLKVKDDQIDLVTSNAVSIAQSKVQPECIPLGIYKDDTPVGFLMYCIDRDDGNYWIYRLMIDKNYQGNGYAKEAMNIIINIIKADKSKHQILLGVDKDGDISIKLYERLGFVFNGQVFGKESIMQLGY